MTTAETATATATAASPAWPARTSRAVGWWLVGLCAVVAGMVLLGGYTRLTHSGLSMVEWRPHGVLPPMSEAEWREAFDGYRASPEFRRINPDMDLAGFKAIFWPEYLHRLAARFLGLALVVPAVWFAARRAFARPLAPRLAGVMALAAAQAVIGWLMVASGLVERPDVSHYRLALHLLTAFALFAWMLWLALGILFPAAPASAAGAGGRRRLRAAVLATGALTVATVTWGAFVAGLDAGFIHNTFPLMGDRPWPDGVATGGVAPALVENPATVQFVHRVLAVSTAAAAVAVLVLARRAVLPPRRRAVVLAVPAVVAGQFTLGVSTLVLHTPVALGVMHQAGALALLGIVVGALAVSREAPRVDAVPGAPRR